MGYLRVYDEAERAIQEYKWMESEKAGRDLGLDAEREWIEVHWRRFCRSRFVRHMRGETFFEEFGAECFGVVTGRFTELRQLLDDMLGMVQEGAENLDILRWARIQGISRHKVLEFLIAIDINGHRLLPPMR